ncbi:MAG: hypothetical protein AAFY31_12265, partial [Pseudomonadota bacterium]
MTDTPEQGQNLSSTGDGATQALDRAQWLVRIGFLLCAVYAGWHLYVLNIAPLETWTFRILHIAGALILGFGMSAALSVRPAPEGPPARLAAVLGGVALLAALTALGSLSAAVLAMEPGAQAPPGWTLAP